MRHHYLSETTLELSCKTIVSTIKSIELLAYYNSLPHLMFLRGKFEIIIMLEKSIISYTKVHYRIEGLQWKRHDQH